jgi:hypothetical protein
VGTLPPVASAVTGISRFDSGLEGWTVEGPGHLEWVASAGGGHIRATRTGPGEVYLVAPAWYGGTCSGSPGNSDMCFSVKTDRAAGRPIGVTWQTSQGDVAIGIETGCESCWFPANRLGGLFGQVSYSPLKIRLGVDPSLPVGEVMLFDNIEFRTSAANCDGSSVSPNLGANDFLCFLNAFASGDPYANFNGLTVAPVINANDFVTFLNCYAQGPGCP